MKFNPHIEALGVYEPGKPIELVVREFGIRPEEIVKLASNENPYGCSPEVVAAVRESAPLMFRYPDDSMMDLKTALARHHGVATGQIIIGSGSDQILEFATRSMLQPGDTVLMNSVTFAMYEIYTRQCGGNIVRTQFRHHHVDEFLDLYRRHRPKIVFLCLPNNPTGDALTRDETYTILEGIDSETMVVVDGAYMEYAAYKDPNREVRAAELTERYPHALYLGTFSKAYGLGGMRVGYGIGRQEVIDALYKLRPPFNITTLGLIAAQAALEDQEFVRRSIADCFTQMARYEVFAQASGIEVIDSFTNFITFMLEGIGDAHHLADALLRRGIIVRNLQGYGLNAIRITIGKEEENSRFFKVFEQLLEKDSE